MSIFGTSGAHNPVTPATAVLPVARSRRRVLPGFRFATSERRLLLAVFDVLALNAALLVVLALRYDYSFSWAVLWQAPFYFILLTIVWGAWASFFDCYDLPRAAVASQSAWCTGRAALLTALTYMAIPFLTPPLPGSRFSAVLFVGLATASVPVWRIFYAAVLSQPTFCQRLLIVGAGHSGAKLARQLASAPRYGNPYASSGFQVVGFVDDDPAKAQTWIEGIPVLGDRNDLRQLVRDQDVDAVVVAICSAPQIHSELLQALLDCREQGVHLEPMASFYERLTGRVPVDIAGNDLHIAMPLDDSPMKRVFGVGKRLFDLVVAFVGLLALVVIAPIVALCNLFGSPGPLFYRQVRVGRKGRPFSVVKFRSMVPDAEKQSGAVWADAQDKRVTSIGRFLRKSRIDELPQVLNILKGEMSLVGPRPERPEFVTDLVKCVPFYQARHAVRPGITGWAQVRYEYGSSVEDALIKLQYDLYYIKHQSLYLETSILVKTAAVMLGGKGR
jgi:exopolysaccharide biosynthesis polyprenyl glycosylphosphotransferase